MNTVLSVVGARPQFIKAAVVCGSLRVAGVPQLLVHTGQHYDPNMSDVFFRELGVPEPDHWLGVGSGSHGAQTGRMLAAVEEVLERRRPGLVVVFGDTNSTLAGALAAAKLDIPVAHVEAGLRSFRRSMPEEVNRVLTDHLAELLFAPTPVAMENLRRESLERGSFMVGDVMLDIALRVQRRVQPRAQQVLDRFGLKAKRFVLATVHRAENTDHGGNLEQIVAALDRVAAAGIPVFFPVHPRTRKRLLELGLPGQPAPARLLLHEPVSYGDMVVLEQNARVIVTDSGGVQKEACFFGTPAVVAREETEWTEAVDAGRNMLAGADQERIVGAVTALWRDGALLPGGGALPPGQALYGSGDAAEKITSILKERL
ncbi:MAG: non-hydrolyzing UDP-N-acetylglucosamine 2-epimerase [Spirochaetota bacterium]